jgi:uncharacterized protein (TIGR00369 family)
LTDAAGLLPWAERAYGYDAAPVDRAVHRLHTGRAVIEMIRDGRLAGSPMWRTAGCTIAEIGDGLVVFTAEPAPFVLNFGGSAHGGWTATLLDSAMGFAVLSKLPAGRLHTTAELSVRYVRAIARDAGPLRVEGRVRHAGRRMATAEGSVLDAAGRLYAHGATTCLIVAVEGDGA